jgi:hypothetical protein
MRIGYISYHPTSPADPVPANDVHALYRLVRAAVAHGFQLHWLSATEAVEGLDREGRLDAARDEDVPATCRHVIPYKAYHLDGELLFSVAEAFWQDPGLHTRLFTFLCLLQRQCPATIFHVWGPLPIVYLGVYTARYLGLPVIGTYNALCLRHGPQQPFMWQWVAEHVTLGLVAGQEHRQVLQATTTLPQHRIRVLDAADPTAGATLAALYHTMPLA